MNWRFFLGACILTGYLLLSAGAPLFAVAAGAFLAAAWNLRHRYAPDRLRRRKRPEPPA